MAAGVAWAGEPADALIPSQALAHGEVRWTGDDAFGRWSLVAGARHEASDPLEAGAAVHLPLPAGVVRHALAAENTSGRLSFDIQRTLFGQRLATRFVATRAALALREDTSAAGASLDERGEWRSQGTRYALSTLLAGEGRWLGLPWQRTLGFRMAGDTLDARNVVTDGGTRAESVLRRESAAESRTSVEARQSFDLARGVSVGASVRLDRVRASVAGDAVPGAPAATFTALAPAFEAAWAPGRGVSVYAHASRGAEDALRVWQAANPFAASVPGAIDPEVRGARADTGMRMGWGAWSGQLAAWQARLPNGLAFGESGVFETSGAISRHGMELGMRYAPTSWLTLQGRALLDLSRTADGPQLPGAPRVFGSAGATLRMSRDLDAKLLVSYLGRRDPIDEGTPLGGTSLASFEVVRWLARTTRVSLDVFNVFNQRPRVVDSFVAARSGLRDGAGESYLQSPSEPRAFLLKFRTHF